VKNRTDTTGKQVPSAPEPYADCEGSSQIKLVDQQNTIFHLLQSRSSLPVLILTSLIPRSSARTRALLQRRSFLSSGAISRDDARFGCFLKYSVLGWWKKKNLKLKAILSFCLLLWLDHFLHFFLWRSTHTFWQQEKCWQLSRSLGSAAHVKSCSGCFLAGMEVGWRGKSFSWEPALCPLTCSLNSASQNIAHLCSWGCSEIERYHSNLMQSSCTPFGCFKVSSCNLYSLLQTCSPSPWLSQKGKASLNSVKLLLKPLFLPFVFF